MASNHGLSNEDISRFSRQIILPEIGPHGQAKLKSASVLIVGAGGLGCPLAIYIAAAGIGRIGIIDYDSVETSNLHRQILHTEAGVGTSKAESIKQAILGGKPLISGSALRWEGQLTVYNLRGDKENERECPCYRCIFPSPPPPETVTNCSDGGVIGAVPGIIGTMQALEIIKIAAGIPSSFAQKLFLFDGLSGQTRTIKLRPRNRDCAVCGDNPSIKELIEYEAFCGLGVCDKVQSLDLLPKTDRVSVGEYKRMKEEGVRHILLDIRPAHEFQICSIKDSINLPVDSIPVEEPQSLLNKIMEPALEEGFISEIFLVCHRGNDTQRALPLLREKLNKLNPSGNKSFVIKDLIGGLEAWSNEIDPKFPKY